MENFLKPFIERGVFFSLENIINKDDSTEFNYIKCLQKVIFKQDVIVELKHILDFACTSEPFTVKNDLVKKMITQLNLLLLSDDDSQVKIDVFRYIFKAFVSFCKDDNVQIMQFFLVLSHLLGMNAVPNVNKINEIDTVNSTINREYFNTAFEVDPSNPTSITFTIFKELLVCLSKLSLNFNLSEIQLYRKWLQQLIKNLAYFQPFQNVFLEMFSVCAEIDLKLLEVNLDHIFNNVLTVRPPVDENFGHFYSSFLEKALDICSKFQRTIKFIVKFLSSIRVTPTVLVKEMILPPNVINKFSKIVAVASNQQSLSFFDILLQNLDECFISISQNSSGCNSLLLYATSSLFISFFKDVKLYAPSISSTTLLMFIEKLNSFKESLHRFGKYLFNNKPFMLKNEDIVKTFLNLCVYCGEIKLLVDCYKDSVLQSSDPRSPPSEYEWHCCLQFEQWKSLISIVLKSKLEALNPICFQLALQKCRECKLKNMISHIDESTLKIIKYQLTAGLETYNMFEQLLPDDFIIAMDVLTSKQAKSVCKKILKRLLETDTKEESLAWLCNSVLQENSVFVLNIFSQILEETGRLLRDSIPEGWHSKISWLSDECMNGGDVSQECLQGLPEKVNFLLTSGKKLRKHVRKNPGEKELILRIVEVFRCLPLAHMKGDWGRVGLCFVVNMASLLSDDENSVRVPFESMCSFLTSDVDASTCFDVGLCVTWLGQVSNEDKNINCLRMKMMEILVRNSPNMKFGLIQLGKMVEESRDDSKQTGQLQMLENRVLLYNELGKCWQRAKKRKADNDLIGTYRSKLARIITEDAKQLQHSDINSKNSKILFKILAIELNRAIKANDESEISVLMAEKFLSHFDFAVKNLKRNFDEPSVAFLTVVLQFTPQLRKFLPEGALIRAWKALKFYDKVNWRFFCSHGSDEEFSEILADLLKMSKKFLKSESEKHSSNCFEIWVSFFELSSESKRQCCQLRLQEFFRYIHNCHLLLRKLPIRKKLFLVKFVTFCVSRREVILTSHMLDTIIQVMIECLDDGCLVEDFCCLFTAETETASAMFLRQLDWSKSKVHLTFVIFKKMLASLMKKCDAGLQPGKDDIMRLSTCAFCLEKWASLLVKREKDFARTTPYFITVLISSVASVTVFPAIKIHLVNCINYFLSISDSHTVSYLMRVLKPGYQQVFNSMYSQFKKYHKYSGKI